MAAVIGVRKRRSAEKPVVKYHVRFEVQTPAEDSVASVRSRMGLLNEAMRRAIRGAEDFKATHADYERGVLELDVWTQHVVGIEEARVSVSVERIGVRAA